MLRLMWFPARITSDWRVTWMPVISWNQDLMWYFALLEGWMTTVDK